MRVYDVLIVGAGPAGAYLAYALARRGLQVLILEKEMFPSIKSCGGGLTAKALRLLDYDIAPVIEDAVTRFVFTYRLERPIVVNTKAPVVYQVDRSAFDTLLLAKAREAGAECLEGVRVNRVELDGRAVMARSGGRAWQGRVLVGADGAAGIVARRLSLRPALRLAATLEARVVLPPERIASYRGSIRTEYGLGPPGYAWIFPKADHLSVGIGRLWGAGHDLRAPLERLAQAEGLLLPPRGVDKWVIPLNPSVGTLHGDRTLLLGDAAGLADPFTGEGLYGALVSARLAADVIVDQARAESPDLREYTLGVQQALRKDLTDAARIARWFFPASSTLHRVMERRPEIAAEFTRLFAGELSYAEFLQSLWQRAGRRALRTLRLERR